MVGRCETASRATIHFAPRQHYGYEFGPVVGVFKNVSGILSQFWRGELQARLVSVGFSSTGVRQDSLVRTYLTSLPIYTVVVYVHPNLRAPAFRRVSWSLA